MSDTRLAVVTAYNKKTRRITVTGVKLPDFDAYLSRSHPLGTTFEVGKAYEYQLPAEGSMSAFSRITHPYVGLWVVHHKTIGLYEFTYSVAPLSIQRVTSRDLLLTMRGTNRQYHANFRSFLDTPYFGLPPITDDKSLHAVVEKYREVQGCYPVWAGDEIPYEGRDRNPHIINLGICVEE